MTRSDGRSGHPAGGEPAAIASLRRWAATERLGPPLHVSQQRIDVFAAATGDANWMHVSPARAAVELPGGKTIAHGFLLLSLTVGDDVAVLASMPGIARLLNYGLDRTRFMAPVPSGATVRVRSRLDALQEKSPGRWLLSQRRTVESDHHDGPVLVADQLTLVVLAD